MGRKDLYICNSVYQLLVSLWIKHSVNSDVSGDLILSNHMNNGSALAERVRAEGCFNQVYYVESFDYARYRTPYSKKERYYEELFPQKVLTQYWPGVSAYSKIYLANPDRFSQLIFNTLSRANADMQVVLFEDGMLSYSPMFLSDIESSRIVLDKPIKRFAYRHVFRRKALCDNIQELL